MGFNGLWQALSHRFSDKLLDSGWGFLNSRLLSHGWEPWPNWPVGFLMTILSTVRLSNKRDWLHNHCFFFRQARVPLWYQRRSEATMLEALPRLLVWSYQGYSLWPLHYGTVSLLIRNHNSHTLSPVNSWTTERFLLVVTVIKQMTDRYVLSHPPDCNCKILMSIFFLFATKDWL